MIIIGTLSRHSVHLLIALTAELKQNGITVDLKSIESIEELLRLARIVDAPQVNDLSSRLKIEHQLTPTQVTENNNAQAQAAQSNEYFSPSSSKQKTRTIIYRGVKMEVEI